MENPFQIFTSPIFGNVRAAYIDGVAWFAGIDVGKALGYTRPDMALSRHVEKADKKIALVATFQSITSRKSGNRQMTIINESGLYSLVMSSHAPQAQEFKRWVTSEVLPTIRKTGSYKLLERQALPLEEPAPADEPLLVEEKERLMARMKKQIAKPCLELAVVYVLLMSNMTIKIGMTKDLPDRIRQIQSETRLEVFDYKTTPYMSLEEARAKEAALKEKYAADCLGGEYFDVRFSDVCKEL